MKKDDLYELIATLTPSEKKVFKEKYATKGNANFIRLFDAIAGGGVKNDADAKKKFVKENFVAHLGKAKSYLYEALLNTLHEQIHSNFARFRILRKIEFAEVLSSRKLTAQALDILQSAADESNAANELELEWLSSFRINQMHGILQERKHETDTIIAIQEKLAECREYYQLFNEVHDVYLLRGTKDAPKLESYYQHPKLVGVHNFKTKKAETIFYTLHSLLNTVARNYKLAQENNLQIIKNIESYVGSAVESELAYINALYNMGLTLQTNGEKTDALIEKLEKFEPVGKWARTNKFVCMLRLKLNNYSIAPRTAEGKKLLRLVEEEWPKYKDELNEAELIKMHIRIGGLYLKEQEYNKALDYFLLFNQSKYVRENRPVIYRVAMLYQLIAYYELENFEWLTTTLRNYKYFQQTNDSFYLIEKHTLEFLSKALRLNTKKERDEAKKRYEKELLKAAESQQSGLAYLFSIDWIKK